MNDSFHLGSLFGITIRVHYLFLATIALLVFLRGPDAIFIAGLLFGLVLLHELGHGLAAKHFGIHVVDITFWPLGGMTRMSEMPEDAKVEGWVAAAGPLMNFALALLALPFYLLAGASTDPVPGLQPLGAASFLDWFIVINMALTVINMVPAFPLDGGKVLRAILARNGDWLGATESAVRVGRWAALATVLLAYPLQNCFLPLIGGFIWWSGTRELWMVRLRHGVITFPFGGTAGFGPFQPGGAPDSLGPREEHAEPVEPDVGPSLGSNTDGFSDADIARLERFRGRLPRGETE